MAQTANYQLMKMAWTTVDCPREAQKLASETVENGLAVCVQIDGPVKSVYHWNGKLEIAREWRLMFKCLDENIDRLEMFVLSRHPYDVPEWVCVEADRVGEAYLKWAQQGGKGLSSV